MGYNPNICIISYTLFSFDDLYFNLVLLFLILESFLCSQLYWCFLWLLTDFWIIVYSLTLRWYLYEFICLFVLLIALKYIWNLFWFMCKLCIQFFLFQTTTTIYLNIIYEVLKWLFKSLSFPHTFDITPVSYALCFISGYSIHHCAYSCINSTLFYYLFIYYLRHRSIFKPSP